MKKLIASKTLVLVILGLTGCQERFTTQEAYGACEEIEERNDFDTSPETFADCVDCYESCGSECALQPTAPATFACPDELEDPNQDGEGDGGGS